MKGNASPEELVVPLVLRVGKHRLAGTFREHLKIAGSCRDEIFVESSTHKMIGWRALRDTYCTWSAVAARPIERVQTRAGHEHIDTTRGYYREVEDRPQLRGSAFPSLAALIEAPLRQKSGGLGGSSRVIWPQLGQDGSQLSNIIVEAPGIEPGSENFFLLLLRAYPVV
jgi:hypothetical protein